MPAIASSLTRRTFVSASLVTIIVITLLLVSTSPVDSVNVTLSPSTTSLTQGDAVTFTTTVTIQSNERIPVQGAQLRIFSDSSGTSEYTSSPYSSPRTMTLTGSNPSGGNYGYGYGYGYDANAGTSHTFGYGYGYGGYTGTVTLTYQCTITTSTSWTARTYYARADIDCGSHTYSSDTTSFAVAAASSTPSGGGGGGGGGGSATPTPQPTTTTQPDQTIEPPPPTTPPGPVTPPPATEEPVPEDLVAVDLRGKITPDGVIVEPIILSSEDGSAIAAVPTGTTAKDANGNPLNEITVQPPDQTAPNPDARILAVAEFGPDGATFEPPITITMTYDPDSLPADMNADDLVLAYYDATTGKWIELDDIVVDTENHTISGKTSHFTQFAVLAKGVPPAEPTPTAPAPIGGEDDDDDLNIWLIIGPIIAVIIIGLVVYLEMRRRQQD